MAWERVTETVNAFDRDEPDQDTELRILDGGAPLSFTRQLRPVLPDAGFVGIDWGDKYMISYSVYASVTAADNWQITVEAGTVDVDPRWVYVAENPELAVVDSHGAIRRVDFNNQGYAYFRIESAVLHISDRFYVPIGVPVSQYQVPEPELEGYKPDSLGAAVKINSPVNLIDNGPDEWNTQVYEVVPSNSDYVAWFDTITGITYPKVKGGVDEFKRNTNPNFIGKNIDLTSVSPGWKKSGETTFRRRETGTKLAKRFFVSCNHATYWPDEGGELFFVGRDNSLHSGIILETLHLGWDIQIGILDRDISDDAISPIKFISPEDWMTKTTGWYPDSAAIFWNRLIGADVLCFTQHELIYPTRGISVTAIFGLPFIPIMLEAYGDCGAYKHWHVNIYGGDSGNPFAFVLNNELVACGQYYQPQNGPGLCFPYAQTLLQNGMNTLADKHSIPRQNLTFADTSAFPTYTQI